MDNARHGAGGARAIGLGRAKRFGRGIGLVGGDETIPYYRYADQALLGNESEFRPPVQNNSSPEAALRLGYILGQDEYGASFSVNFRSTTLAIPDLAVGRLVETASEALTMVDS